MGLGPQVGWAKIVLTLCLRNNWVGPLVAFESGFYEVGPGLREENRRKK